ncbi:hypothetical protein KSZ_70790 [Dictyobacter formicarum]|uniref:Uncharacterized protein n=1 Tax=Dictyobacter formicarum TaxID=2778368 RepID=A0ABQ3VUK3_9CHLR|nr:hypothetical protein KSZ_70790 [Dictyobacter formicarum]
MTMRFWNGYAKYALHGHGMATITPVMEEAASALPLAIIISGRVNIVLTLEFGFKTRELNALRLFCIAFGFGNLVDHT